MKYERFTQWTESGASLILDNPQNAEEARNQLMEKFKLACNKLAELEDDLESGKIIRLPCKVGDTVYKVMPVCGVRRIVEFEVHRISIYGDEICIFFTKSKGGFGHEWCTKPQHIGKTVFLTREEAEAKLKELQE